MVVAAAVVEVVVVSQGYNLSAHLTVAEAELGNVSVSRKTSLRDDLLCLLTTPLNHYTQGNAGLT